MPYVQRDNDQKIVGLYANKQDDYAEEWLPDDNPEVIAYLAEHSPNFPNFPTNP